jgi:hypothetical protein
VCFQGSQLQQTFSELILELREEREPFTKAIVLSLSIVLSLYFSLYCSLYFSLHLSLPLSLSLFLPLSLPLYLSLITPLIKGNPIIMLNPMHYKYHKFISKKIDINCRQLKSLLNVRRMDRIFSGEQFFETQL